MNGPKVFYASGAQAWRGNARADGKGGLLARGWWLRTAKGALVGPFTTERKAENAYDPADDAC
jgi:hypothetical protein